MPETMEATAQINFGMHVRLKRNKLIFFALNLLLVIPWALKRYSPWGWAGAAVILLLMFLFTVHIPDADYAASRSLPFIGFFDVCIWAVLSWQRLVEQFSLDNAAAIFERLEVNPCFILMLAMLVLGIFLQNGPRGLWAGGLGRAAAGAFFILLLCSDCMLPRPSFYSGTQGFFVLYLLCSVGWLFLCAAAYYTDPQTQPVSNCLTWLLLAALLILCVTETSLIQPLASAVWEWLLDVPSAGLAWWKVLLAAVVLTGASVAAYDYDGRKMGPDSLVLGILAGGVLLLRILISRYFAFHWVLFLTFLTGSLRCLYNECRQAKTLRFTSSVYLTVQLAVLVLAAQMLKTGLWLLVILLCVYGLVFYATVGKTAAPGYRLFHWLTVLSCPAVLAVGYIWQRCFVKESCIFVLVMYAVFAFAILILSWRHPDQRICPDVYKWILCGFMTVLCLIAATRHGTRVQVTFHKEDCTAVIALEAQGKGNTVASASIRWGRLIGEGSGEERVLSAAETTVPIEDEKLTIVVTDAYGSTTTVTDWYPRWLLEQKG